MTAFGAHGRIDGAVDACGLARSEDVGESGCEALHTGHIMAGAAVRYTGLAPFISFCPVDSTLSKLCWVLLQECFNAFMIVVPEIDITP